MRSKLQTQSYKGARDFYPQDMLLRNYIFETWKKVCVRYGFEEYDFPILEPLEIFSAKSGTELVNNQLFSFEDRGGRKIAIRPELTPGTVRMIAQKFNEIPRPIKWFMIGNNWRYEKPQLGRGREFYQLEANIFGVQDISADLEIFSLIIALLKEFGATEKMFELRFSDRRLVNGLLLTTLGLDEETSINTRRMMDKFQKVGSEVFAQTLSEYGLNASQIDTVSQFLTGNFDSLPKILSKETIANNQGYKNLVELFSLLQINGLEKYTLFDPTIIRGFDYSDGLVYEVFDKNPNNRRSLFGGERFDKLIEIFGNYKLAATGFAMGDWTFPEFLNNWSLVPALTSQTQYFVTLWPSDDPIYQQKTFEVSSKLRENGLNVFTWIEPFVKLDKQLKFANQKKYNYVVIIGESEVSSGSVTIKDLTLRTQKTIQLSELLTQSNIVNKR